MDATDYELYDARTTVHRLRKIPERGLRLLDIGANVGVLATTMQFDFEWILCLEPRHDTYHRLLRNTHGIRNIIRLNRAVVGKPPASPLYISRTAKTTCAAVSQRTDDPASYYQPVMWITLKNLLEKYPYEVVKLDVEGAEYEILDSMDEWPECVRYLFVEFHGLRHKRWHVFKELMKKMAPHFSILSPSLFGCRPDGYPSTYRIEMVFARGQMYQSILSWLHDRENTVAKSRRHK